MSSTPDWEAEFGKVSYCSMCGDSNFMCDCDRHNVDDFDVMDDVEED